MAEMGEDFLESLFHPVRHRVPHVLFHLPRMDGIHALVRGIGEP